MAWSLSTLNIKDGGGATVPIIAGTDATNYSFGHILIDGVAGVNAAQVDSGHRLLVAVSSGGIASGAIASGAIASGAIASGAVASGAFASGAFASGSGADGWNVTLGATTNTANTATDTTAATVVGILKACSSYQSRILSSTTPLAPSSALATTAFAIGSVFNTTQQTVANTQQASFSMSARGAMIVNPGVESFAVAATLGAETTKVIGTVNVSASQTIAATQATAASLNTKSIIWDGTTVPTVKAASTAPAAGDTALVVAVSPNGEVASGATDSGNPAKIGGRAITAISGVTPVTTGQRTDAIFGLDGSLVVRDGWAGATDIVTGNATNTDGTATACIAASGDAAIKTYLTSVILCNTSATAITVDIKDDTTVKISLPLPAGSGCIFNPPVPIPGTANKAWNFDPSAAATTVTCSMVGYKSKI